MRKIKQMLAGKFSEQVYYGYWYSPEAEYVRFCLDKGQENVEGKVTLNLFKGHVCSYGSTVYTRDNFSPLYSRYFSHLDQERFK